MTARILVAALLLLLASPSVAQTQDGVLQDYQIEGGDLTLGIAPTYGPVAVRVAGPGAWNVSRTFDRGQTLLFSLGDFDSLPDGAYTFEITGTPSLSAGMRSRLESARAAGDNLLMAALLKDAGVNPENSVETLTIGVQGGRFIPPTPETEPAAQPVREGDTAGRASGAAGSSNWTRAQFQLNMGSGETQVFEGFVLPPEMASDNRSYARAVLRPRDATQWTQGYFTENGGSYTFISHSQFAAAGLNSSDGHFAYLAAQPTSDLPPALRDQVINDDLIVTGSQCVGTDCVNGESFGFDTIRLKENNVRLKFDDTSTSASFPRNDWQLTANDSNNGGANRFSIDDITGGRTPFTIEATAPSHSLYVDDAGNLGLGTSTPVVEIHTVDGDTPTLRLEQNGSSGFGTQIWDIAGNEANFFVRDATNGSKLPFKIKPNAPNNSIFVDADGDIGFGTQTPSGGLQIVNGSGASDDFVVDNDGTVSLADGSAGVPAIRFNDDPDTGFFRSGDGEIKMSLNGVETAFGSGGGSAFDGAISDGTAGTPGLRFSGDTDTGIWRSGPNQLSLGTGGVQAFRVDGNQVVHFSRPVGNSGVTLGDGTASPELVISGGDTGYHNAAVVLKAQNSANFRALGIYLFDEGGDTEWFFGRPYTNSDRFVVQRAATASHDRGTADPSSHPPFLAISGGGQVGIGVPNPTAILQVAQSSASDPIADAWTVYSSRRWKQNIRTIEEAGDIIGALRGVRYEWAADGKPDIGLIAEDVAAVLPEIVVMEENGIDARSLDYSRLVAVLIEAVREQSERIEALEAVLLGKD